MFDAIVLGLNALLRAIPLNGDEFKCYMPIEKDIQKIERIFIWKSVTNNIIIRKSHTDTHETFKSVDELVKYFKENSVMKANFQTKIYSCYDVIRFFEEDTESTEESVYLHNSDYISYATRVSLFKGNSKFSIEYSNSSYEFDSVLDVKIHLGIAGDNNGI